jgi:hypothetical protein
MNPWNFAPEFASDVKNFNPEWAVVKDLNLSQIKAIFVLA